MYGVENKITWFEGDCFEILKKQLKDLAPYSVLFGSPPWGGKSRLSCFCQGSAACNTDFVPGPGYRSDEVFNLRTMEPYPLSKLYEEFSSFTDHVVLYLPRTSDLKQLAKVVKDDDKKATVMHYCMEGASKALCVYYGDFNVE